MDFFIKRILNMLLVVSQYSPFALIWMAKAFFIDWPLRIWSLYRLPKKAEGMGLRYVESDYEKEFGTIQGRMQGYAVEIKPDDHMESTIRIITGRKDSKLEVSLARPSMRPKKNIQDFTTGNWKFNLAFKTKRAPVRSIDRLSENNDLFDALVEFYSRWIFVLEALFIDYGEICCTFRYGFNFFPYIPAHKLEEILEQLVSVAEKHDALFST